MIEDMNDNNETNTIESVSDQSGTAETLGEPITDENLNQEETYDWMKDERYETTWNKDSNSMYKDLREYQDNIEKKYMPLESSYSDVVQKFKENELDINNINEYMDTYKNLTDPNNPTMVTGKYMMDLYENPHIRPLLESFFNDITIKERQRQFPNWTDQQVKEHLEQKTRLETLEKQVNEGKKREDDQIILKKVNDQINAIKTFAKDSGMNFTKELEKDFIQHAINRQIPVDYFLSEWKNLNHNEVDQFKSKRIEEDIIRRINKNNKNPVMTQSSSGSSKKDQSSFEEKLTHAIDKLEGG